MLSLRCPHDKCNALVTEELARRFMGPECCEKLSTFQWRSWVDDNPKARLHSCRVHLLTTPSRVLKNTFWKKYTNVITSFKRAAPLRFQARE